MSGCTYVIMIYQIALLSSPEPNRCCDITSYVDSYNAVKTMKFTSVCDTQFLQVEKRTYVHVFTELLTRFTESELQDSQFEARSHLQDSQFPSRFTETVNLVSQVLRNCVKSGCKWKSCIFGETVNHVRFFWRNCVKIGHKSGASRNCVVE